MTQLVIEGAFETIRTDADKVRVVDFDGMGLRAYDGHRVIAEKHKDRWVTTLGEDVGEEVSQILNAKPVSEKMKVRSGVKPLPPKSYWEPDMGQYVSSEDEEWSASRYESLKKKAR